MKNQNFKLRLSEKDAAANFEVMEMSITCLQKNMARVNMGRDLTLRALRDSKQKCERLKNDIVYLSSLYAEMKEQKIE